MTSTCLNNFTPHYRDSGWIGGGGVKYFRGSVFIKHSYIIALLPPPSPTISADVATRFVRPSKKRNGRGWGGASLEANHSDASLGTMRTEPNLEQSDTTRP